MPDHSITFSGAALRISLSASVLRMFEDQAFQSWMVILVGAVFFAALFVLLAMMMELLFEGAFQVTRTVVGFGVIAFFGYIGTALILRRSPMPPPE